MLHKETVTPATLELIKALQSEKIFKDFYLVGGTALSLQIGHRISVDIDLFSQNEFDTSFFIEYLEKKYDFKLQYVYENTLKGFINEIFIDILRHNHPNIYEPIIQENIRLLSKADIAAMKVNAITGNGTRLKDFVDIYFLFKEFTYGEIIEFYSAKYGKRNEFHAVKSLTYFEDIVLDDKLNMLLEKNISIEDITAEIKKKRDAYIKK